jgi:hypothetical protein
MRILIVVVILVALSVFLYYSNADNGESLDASHFYQPLPERVIVAVAPNDEQQNSEHDQNTETRTPPALFTDAKELELDHEVIANFTSTKPMTEFRIVTVDTDSFRTFIREPTTGVIEIKLLDDDYVKLVTQGARESHSGWSTGFGMWIGKIEGVEESSASFQVNPDGSMDGRVLSARLGRIKIEPIKGTPHHLIWRFDPSITVNID